LEESGWAETGGDHPSQRDPSAPRARPTHLICRGSANKDSQHARPPQTFGCDAAACRRASTGMGLRAVARYVSNHLRPLELDARALASRSAGPSPLSRERLERGLGEPAVTCMPCRVSVPSAGAPMHVAR